MLAVTLCPRSQCLPWVVEILPSVDESFLSSACRGTRFSLTRRAAEPPPPPSTTLAVGSRTLASTGRMLGLPLWGGWLSKSVDCQRACG